MKILTITGTRPELIRLSVIIKKLDVLSSQTDLHFQHILLYTNQNYDYNLSTRFFNDLKIRKPDYYFEKEATSFGDFVGNSVIEFEKILKKEMPDKILVLGDTNSGLLSIVANKYKIPIYHMEAGNRCYDNRVPEEYNRRIIDAVSTYNLPYTKNSKENLLKEGYHKNNVFCIGNPIYEVLQSYKEEINKSGIRIMLPDPIKYVLVTMHRSENVDNKRTLENLMSAISTISDTHHVVLSLHPRTKQKMEEFGIILPKRNIQIEHGFGFFDFVNLEKYATCVITDSGTVPEECCIFGVPVLTIRESIERQETIECGSNILVGTQTKDILNAFAITSTRHYTWVPPEEYMVSNVSDVVINLLTGKP